MMSRFVLFVLLGLVAAGCGPPGGDDGGPGAKRGTPERLVFAFQRQKDPAQVKADAERVGAKLGAALGIPVDVVVPTVYSATVQALVSNRAQVAYLSALPYLLAKREAPVEILLVEERADRSDYDSVFVVRDDSPARTLADLRGKRIAFTSATSASGYVFPLGHLVQAGLMKAGGRPESFFRTAAFAGGYDKALRAVLRGQVDVAAVSDYTMEGPTADKYLSPTDRASLRILERAPGVPTHLIVVRSDLDPDLRAKVKAVLLEFSRSEPELLRDVYGAATFAEPDGSQVRKAEDALARAGLGLDALVE